MQKLTSFPQYVQMDSDNQSKNFDKFIYFGDNVNYIGDRVNFDRAIKVLEREISYLNYEYKLECAQAQRDGSDVNHTRYERNIAELKAAIEKLQQD